MGDAFVADVVIMPKADVNDPQGLVTRDSLKHLGFESVEDVRIGKHIEIQLLAASAAAAESLITGMCDRLLCNSVIEDYKFQLRSGSTE